MAGWGGSPFNREKLEAKSEALTGLESFLHLNEAIRRGYPAGGGWGKGGVGPTDNSPCLQGLLACRPAGLPG
jgi:hypothetical protein